MAGLLALHFANTGPHFPYRYYIGLMSALRAAHAPVKLWVTEVPKTGYFEDVPQGDGLTGVEVVYVKDVPDFPALAGASDHHRRVAIFDWVILKAVAEEGGAVMGLDSITIGDVIGLLPADKELLVARDSEVDPKSYAMHAAVFQRGSELAQAVYEDALEALNGDPTTFKWGDAGITPILERAWENPDRVEVAPWGVLGGFHHDGRPLYVFRNTGLIDDDCRTIPFYDTVWTETKQLCAAYVRRSDSLYARLVRQVLNRREWDVSDHRRFRFHLLGLAHLPTVPEISACAYTQKVVKLAEMLTGLGHTVMFYGVEGSRVVCHEFVEVLDEATRLEVHGPYDWHRGFFKHSGGDKAQTTFNERAIEAIQARQQPGDFLLCTMGTYQQPIAAASQCLVVEPGIGYRGVFAKYRAYESYAWMHYLWGRKELDNGDFYQVVIPNYFDPADFPLELDKRNYALYMGRLIWRKGVQIAVEATERLGMPLLIAGQGKLVNPKESLDIRHPHVTFLGAVGPEERKTLMGRAKLCFLPTIYIEPFGGTAVEAQFCGTPVLTTDWGAMSETVLHGVTGYRCRTLEQFTWAARNIHTINPMNCREWAVSNYSTDRVRWQFQEFFEQVADLRGPGWYAERPYREQLDWLRRFYPAGVDRALNYSMG